MTYSSTISAAYDKSSFVKLSYVHLIFASVIFVLLVAEAIAGKHYQFVIFSILTAQYIAFQVFAIKLCYTNACSTQMRCYTNAHL